MIDPILRKALQTLYPFQASKDIVALGWVQQASLDKGEAQIILEIPSSFSKEAAHLETQLKETLDIQVPGLNHVKVIISAHQAQQPKVKKPEPIPNITNILAIASGKGGVGKSTTAFHLALTLSRLPLKVGLLDLDIYGPSLPHLLNCWNKPLSTDGKTMEPLEKEGLKWMSMGLLMPPDKAAIWRGPMVHSAVQQLVHQVNWGNLDVMILDLPPGTGDVPLSLAQSVPLTGAIMVTTPQEIALLDVRRCIEMFQKLNIPIFGLIENMAGFTCPTCHTTSTLFGQGGGKQEAQHHAIPFLGSIPLFGETEHPLNFEIYDKITTKILSELKK